MIKLQSGDTKTDGNRNIDMNNINALINNPKIQEGIFELEELVNVKGLSFGMDLSKYKLDKD